MTWCSQCASLPLESLYLQGPDLRSKAGAFIVIIVVVVAVVVVVDILNLRPVAPLFFHVV